MKRSSLLSVAVLAMSHSFLASSRGFGSLFSVATSSPNFPTPKGSFKSNSRKASKVKRGKRSKRLGLPNELRKPPSLLRDSTMKVSISSTFSFFLDMFGLGKKPLPNMIGPVVNMAWSPSGKTVVTIDADYLVLDADRIDIAPSWSPRRSRQIKRTVARSLPNQLGSRSRTQSPKAVDRIRERRASLLNRVPRKKEEVSVLHE